LSDYRRQPAKASCLSAITDYFLPHINNMDHLGNWNERRPIDLVLFGLIFFSLILFLAGIVMTIPAMAFAFGALALISLLPFALRGSA
jgi:hypothetical protein